MTPKNLIIYSQKEDLLHGAALLLAGAIRETLRHKAVCTFSLAGGTTPGPVYRMLTDAAVVGELPLKQVEILFGDERCVPPDHPDSNYKAAKEAFGAAVERFRAVHRIHGERDFAEAAAEYEEVLQSPIDVQLLGMGPDAHIASVFPGSTVFEKDTGKTAAVECPKPPPRRITVTPPVIVAAQQTFVLAAGAEKATALAEVFTTPYEPTKRPAQLVWDATWLVDEAAASALNLFRRNEEHA